MQQMMQESSRRSWLKRSIGAAGLSVFQVAGPNALFGQSGGQVIPWLDQPPPNPNPANIGNLMKWEELESWQTPANRFFYVSHFGVPAGLNASDWRVEFAGLLARPRTLTLSDIKAQESHEVDFTMECSGNTIVPGVFFQGAVGNARWGGARLAPLLESMNILDEASEVVFWGSDTGRITLRDNVGITGGGRTGTVQPDSTGGADLTITEQFARSMTLKEALSRDNLLAYQMNGEALPPEHGFPLRLIAPGWYGVANVKWLTRIEVIDRRFAGNFMARDYVSVRETQRGNNETVWTFATVGRDRLKSAAAKVTRLGGRYSIMGAAWGAPIASVEVQIDGGPWRPAILQEPAGRPARRQRDYSWRFWTFDWGTPPAGEHAIVTRAIDLEGNVQPAANDPFLTGRVTYWESNGQVLRRVLIP